MTCQLAQYVADNNILNPYRAMLFVQQGGF